MILLSSVTLKITQAEFLMVYTPFKKFVSKATLRIYALRVFVLLVKTVIFFKLVISNIKIFMLLLKTNLF